MLLNSKVQKMTNLVVHQPEGHLLCGGSDSVQKRAAPATHEKYIKLKGNYATHVLTVASI